MEDYVGKTCPFCKTEIKEGENIKVCDACGIPHHQECWDENKGCTTFGCSGCNSEQNHTCGNCGCELREGLNFCTNCGQKIYMYDNTDDQQFFNEQLKEKKHRHKFAKAIKNTIFFRKKKNCIITSSCFALVVFITLSLCFAGSVFFSVAYNSGNFDYAQQIKEMYSDNDFVSKNIDGFLSSRVNKTYNKYNKGKITIEEARRSYDDVARFKNIILEKYDLDDLVESKSYYDEAENYLNNGDYINAFYKFEKIITKDTNYKKAKSEMINNQSNLSAQVIKKLEGYENSGDFVSGLALIEDVSNFPISISEITSKKEIFRQHILKQLSEYEEAGNYTDGLNLIDRASYLLPDDTDIAAKKTTFDEMKESAKLQELVNSQELTVITAYCYKSDNPYSLTKNITAIIKNNTGKTVKEFYIGFLLFSGYGFPVEVTSPFQGIENLQINIADDLSIKPGNTYGEDYYWETSILANNIKACVISAKYTDGTEWRNEYADYWYTLNKDNH